MDDWKNVYIDQAEEINTVIAQLKGLPEKKIALIIDANNRLLTQKTNLKLLHMYLTKAGKEIRLISDNPAVQAAAAEMQLGASLDESEVLPVQSTLFKLDKNYICVLTIGLFFVLTVSALYFSWPSCTVELTPELRTVRSSLVLEFSPDFKEASGSKLPARVVEKEISSTLSRAATGKKLIGVSGALGKVILLNEGSGSVALKAGTLVSTVDGVNFLLADNVVVPGRRVESFMGVPVGISAGRAVVSVKAAALGSRGNVPAGAVSCIKVANLRVVNPAPFKGGEDKEVSVISEGDLLSLEKDVQRKVRERFMQLVKEDLSANYKLLDNSLTLQGIALRYDKNAGEQGDKLTAEAKGTGRIFLVANSDLEKSVSQFLQAKAGKSYSLVGQSAEITWNAGMLVSPVLYRAEINASRLAEADLVKGYWRKKLKELPVSEMKKYLTNSAEIASFKIIQRRRLILLPEKWQRVKIVLKNQYKKE